MVRVEGGTFTMGATSEQGNSAYSDEKPTHHVTLNTYFIGETEVTQKLWQAVMGNNPSKFKGAKRPVEQVSWGDCQDFIQRLNQLTGRSFRLPTEAEWEYAARGGKKSKGYKYAGSSSIGDVAWYDGNSGKQTHDVATKRANELGLYDMSGNVCEWCQDWKGWYSSDSQTNPTGDISGDYRVIRGGSHSLYDWSCRVSNRSATGPWGSDCMLGLRLVLEQANRVEPPTSNQLVKPEPTTKPATTSDTTTAAYNTDLPTSPKPKPDENKIFDDVEQAPTFKEGDVQAWLAKNMKYPRIAAENGISGRVVVGFVVELDGSISQVQVLRGVDPSLDKEAVRLVKSMPKWNPGMQNGYPVRVKYKTPVQFKLQ